VTGTLPETDSAATSAPQPLHRASPTAAPRVASAFPPGVTGERAVVVQVIDGDTVTVQVDGQRAVVRLIGIDAPESRGPSTEPACYAAEARQTLQHLLASANGTVVLERDVSELDRYDRLLRYLWTLSDDGWVLVNEELVRQGAAVSRRYPPDVKYAERLERAERAARAAGAGLWSACHQPVAPVPVAPPGLGAERPGCDPAYPDVCIPPPPPDLDCPDVPYRRFRVLSPDPHRFDRDGDGIGCEG
jgi:micrococcal nuclease